MVTKSDQVTSDLFCDSHPGIGNCSLSFLDDLLGNVRVGLGDGEVEGAAAHAGLVEGVQVGAGVDQHAGSLQCSR